jgi:integrase
MNNETKSKKYTGVYYRTLEDKSKTFYIVYKDPIEKKSTRLKIGNSKDGFNEAYANNKCNEIVSKLRLGEDPNIPILKKKQHGISLNDIFPKYISSIKTKSVTSMRSRYKTHLYNDVGLKDLGKITKSDMTKFQKRLQDKGLSNATVNDVIVLGSTVTKYAIKHELYKGLNPFQGIKKIKLNNERLRYLSKDEIELLKDSTKHDKALYLFILLAVTTGARLQSILSIQKKDINFTTNTININDFKNKDKYIGGITKEVKELIEIDFKALKNDDYIVSEGIGVQVDSRRLQRRLVPILNKLFNQGLDTKDSANRVVIHTLRHTFASQLAINGTSIYTIQKLMNHKDLTQTMRYAKLSPESGINAVLNIFD